MAELAQKTVKTVKGLVDKLKSSHSDVARGLGEMDALVRQESAKAYTFYQQDHDSRDRLPAGGLSRKLSVGKALFLSFLRKLTPARRLAYLAALVAFVWGYLQGDWAGAFVGFVVLNFLLALELAEKLLTKDELEIARSIQFSLYPAVTPEIEHLDVACYFQPANVVGGDYFDYALDENRRFTVILGDVSGKGMPAALYAMKLQALFEILVRGALGPKQMLTQMNDVISARIERKYFITAVVGVLDFHRSRLLLSRAGHNHPLHYAAATTATRWLRPNGIGIGMGRGTSFDDLLEEVDVSLAPGDVLLFYTDGVSEAMNAANETFGYDRLERVLRETAHLPASEIKQHLLRSVERFRQGTPFADDATFVVTKCS
jgi:sigma-B regulation protein RsbU (phosphoserine phosphatase)